MNNIINIESKVCIITGVGKGIGHETAIAFKDQGAKLGIITRSIEDLESILNILDMPADHVYYQSGDVSDEDTVKKFVFEVFSKFKRIDILVNNAGIRFRKKF